MPTSAAPVREPARTATPAAASQPAAGPVIAVGGVRMYRMRDGRWIQLPEDMTAADAARLEAEGAEAEKRVVKAPPLGPAPNVRKPAKKEPAKQRPRKAAAKVAPGKGAAQAAAAAAGALLGAVGSSKVAQYLATKALPALTRGVGALARLKQNEQTHDDGAEKLRKSEDAVVNPPSEGQSKSNTGQVDEVGERPAPPVDEQKGKARLQQSLAQYLPKDMETADNFKRDQKAQRMGADVLEVVQGDKNAVVGTFGAMSQTPPAAPPEHTPVELPPPESAPRTAPLNLGQGAVAELQKEHTDVSDYTKQADGKLKEEGVTQEQLDMVDGGELAEANKEKKGMEQKAKSEPLAIQDFARQEATRVDKDLAQDEKAGREEMQTKRKVALAHTAGRQRGAKSALERKRDEVAAKINGIFKAAQDSVTRKLDALEKESMKRFDDGNAAASKQFEESVNRELEAYKDDRYSGMFGWARKAKDWLLGMDDLPRVKEIFDSNRAIFVKAIDKLVADISADNKRVIQECRNELAEAKKQIQIYVDSLEPGLKGIGRKAAGEMSEKLAELDQNVSKREEELKNKLKDKQTAAIKAIDQKIEKMKEAMSGALAKLGKLLLWAAKKFFTWALGKFGVSLSTIEGIIDKGVAVLKAIFTAPIQFVKNLIRAAMTGFGNFAEHFLTHLKDAVFAWLTDSLEGVVLPETWNLKGILSVALQLVGISGQNVKARLKQIVPPAVVDGLEKTFDLARTLFVEGPMAAWEQLKEIGAEMRDAFVEAIKNWILVTIIKEAVKAITLMFIPGAGIIKAIIAIYDTIVFFIQKAKQIIEMVGNFLGSVAEIAAGNIGAAADALEQGLARGLKLVIFFLAKLIKLDKVTEPICKAIKKIHDKVDAVIDKVANWVVNMAKKAGKFLASKALGGEPNARPELRLEAGVNEGVTAVNRLTGRQIGIAAINPVLAAIRLRHNLKVLRAEPSGGLWSVVGEVNPKLAKLTEKPAVIDATTKGATRREYGGLDSGFGTWGRVTGLQKLGDENPPSVDDAKYWPALAKRLFRRGGSTYYVRGHLINGKFGGPGGDWHNLTPLTQAANNRSVASMLHTFENPVKEAVASNGTVDVDVRAVYKHPDRSADIAKVKGKKPSAEDKAIASIIEAEQHIPSQIVATAHIVSGGGGAKDPASTTENVIDTNLDNYFHADYPSASAGTARRIVDLNSASDSELKGLVGVTNPVLQLIKKNRKYRDRDDFIEKVSDSVWHSMMSTAGVKLTFD